MIQRKSLLKNKRGILDLRGDLSAKLFGVFIFAGILVFGILIYYVLSLLAPPLISSFSTFEISFREVTAFDGNLSAAEKTTFGNLSLAFNGLKWVSYVILFALFFAFCITAFYIRTYPFLIVVWIGVIIIMVIMGLYLAQTYNDLKTSGSLSSAYTGWAGNDYILGYLPHIIAIFGLVGGIILFVLSSSGVEQEVTL